MKDKQLVEAIQWYWMTENADMESLFWATMECGLREISQFGSTQLQRLQVPFNLID